MSGRFTPAMQNSVVNLYLAAVNRNVDGIIDELVSLGALDPDADRAAVGHVLELVIDDLEGSETVNWQQIISEVTGMLHEFPFRIPPDIMLVLRVGSISEGVLRQLDPEFDFLAAASLIGTALLAAVDITCSLVGVGAALVFIALFITSPGRLSR